jgi:hypothetical protein
VAQDSKTPRHFPPDDSEGVVLLTRRCCPYLGKRLPDHHSCAMTCDEFPRCLPSLPAATRLQLATMFTETATARDDLVATVEFLEALDAAITKGLKRKGDGHGP